MTTRITRMEDQRHNRMVLKLEGTLTVADAKLLEEICADLRDELGYGKQSIWRASIFSAIKAPGS